MARFTAGTILATYSLTASKSPIGACFPRQIVDKPSPNDEGSTSLAKREVAYDSASTYKTRTELRSAADRQLTANVRAAQAATINKFNRIRFSAPDEEFVFACLYFFAGARGWHTSQGGGRIVVISQAAEQRQNPRIATVPRTDPDGAPDHPLLLNVSADGACLWLSEAPPVDQYLVLSFRCQGQDRVLRSRIVWSRSCKAMSNRTNLPSSEGWLAGINLEHADTDIRIDAIPHDILHAGQAIVSFDSQDEPSVEQQLGRDVEERSSDMQRMNQETNPALEAASQDLAPIFAKHFSDVRLVSKGDRLELSASLRAPDQETVTGTPQSAQAAIETRQEPSVVTPESVELPSDMAAPRVVPAGNWPGREFVLLASVAAIILVAFYFGVLRDSGESAEDPGLIVALQISPQWAQGLGLDDEVLDGWVEIKQTFDLPDKTMRSMILMMRDNEKYPSGHDLHDLSKHPMQTGRALSLLAAAKAESATTLDIGLVKDDLESRLMAGARFPDEPPGGRYSSLQRELYHNLVVLGVVDLLHRRKDATPVREILAALPQRKLEQQTD